MLHFCVFGNMCVCICTFSTLLPLLLMDPRAVYCIQNPHLNSKAVSKTLHLLTFAQAISVNQPQTAVQPHMQNSRLHTQIGILVDPDHVPVLYDCIQVEKE